MSSRPLIVTVALVLGFLACCASLQAYANIKKDELYTAQRQRSLEILTETINLYSAALRRECDYTPEDLPRVVP